MIPCETVAFQRKPSDDTDTRLSSLEWRVMAVPRKSTRCTVVRIIILWLLCAFHLHLRGWRSWGLSLTQKQFVQSKALGSTRRRAFEHCKSCKKFRSSPESNAVLLPGRQLKASPTSLATVRNHPAQEQKEKIVRPANLCATARPPFELWLFLFSVIQPRAGWGWHCVWRSLDLSTVSSYAVRRMLPLDQLAPGCTTSLSWEWEFRPGYNLG